MSSGSCGILDAPGRQPVRHRARETPPGLIVAEHSLIAAGEFGILEDVADDLGERDRRNRKIVGSKPERRYADQQTRDDRREDRRRNCKTHRPLEVDDKQRHRVGADGHEAGLPEVQQSGEAGIQLQAERRDAVDARDHRHADPEVEAHSRVRRRPNMPRGMNSSVRIRMTNPTAGFHRGLKNSVDHSWLRPRTMPPASAP